MDPVHAASEMLVTNFSPPLSPRPLEGPAVLIANRISRAPLVVAAALALTALFWPSLWQGGGLIGGDVYHYYLPQKAFYAECLRGGTLPFWNNRIGNGYPQLAESQTGALYPLNLALYRWLDLNTAYNASTLWHYCMAFVGCWLLARQINLAPLAAALAALVFTYSWFPPRISLEWTIVGGAWLPTALWCVESFLQQQRPRCWAVMLMTALGLQMLAGHFQIAFLTQLLIVCYVPLRLWFTHNDLSEAARVNRGAIYLLLLAAVAGSYLLAAIQLLPTWELKQLSQRSGLNVEHDPANGAVPPQYLEQIFAPWAWYPDRDAFIALHDPKVQQRISRVDSHLYFGMLPLVLIIVGLWCAWRDSNRSLLIWLALGIAAILYMPGWFLPITRHLPGFSYFEGPGRYGIVATLAAALLAGAGFQYLLATSSILFSFRSLYAAAVFAVTTADLFSVSLLVHDAEQIEKPPVKLISKSQVHIDIVGEPTKPVRMFSEGWNVPSLVGAGTLPAYLGLSPAAYYDPRLTLPKPYPFWTTLPTPEQVDWLRRMGATHILSQCLLDTVAWPVQLSSYGADPCLNPILGMEPNMALFIYELQGSRGRVAWLDADSEPPPRIVKYTPHRVEVAVESEQGGTLVLTDLDYPGWQVEIDSHPAAGLVVDGMLRGVALPPGMHKVTWSYRPASFFWGATISAVSLIAMAVFAGVPRRKP